jgi:hypothetical protein
MVKKKEYRLLVPVVLMIVLSLLFVNCTSIASILSQAGVAKEVELKYDSGKAKDFIALCGSYLLVDFFAQGKPLVISKIRLAGAIVGQLNRESFQMGICDANKKIIWEDTYPVTIFDKVPIMAEIDVPDVEVTNKFYVFVWTGTCPGLGLQIGADDSTANQHSTIATRSSPYLMEIPWNSTFPANTWSGTKSKVNWMVRVVGEYRGK